MSTRSAQNGLRPGALPHRAATLTAAALALTAAVPLWPAAPALAEGGGARGERLFQSAGGYLVPLAPGVTARDLRGLPGHPALPPSSLGAEEEEGSGPEFYDPANLDPSPTPDIVRGVSRNYRVTDTFGRRGKDDWRSRNGDDVSDGRIIADIPPMFSVVSDWFATGPFGQLNSQTGAGPAGTVSGRVADLAGHPTDPNTFYVAAAGGGVWKTTNGGVTYAPITDLQPNAAVGAVAVSRSNPEIVWVGTGEGNFSADSRYGSGLLKSTDGGVNWLVIPGPSNVFVRRSISEVVIHPTNPNTVYVAVVSGAGGVGGNYGVWKTTDGGTTWTNTFTLPGNPGASLPVTDLIINPASPNTLYAAFTGTGGGTGAGVYKTTNGGTNWALVDSSLPRTTIGRTALALCDAAPDTVYVSIATSAGRLQGVYKTTTGGTAAGSWVQLTATPDFQSAGQGWYNTALIVSPANPDFVFCAGSRQSSGSAVCSVDGGVTWRTLDVGQSNVALHVDHHAFAFLSDGRLVNGNDGGVWVLENAAALTPTSGFQWTNRNAGLNTIQFTGVGIHPTQTIAYGGSQDNGTARYNGSTWSAVRGGDGGFFRVDQAAPTTVYSSQQRISLARSDNSGTGWVSKVPPGASGGLFYPPFLLDLADQATVLYGTSSLYRSINRGDSWSTIAAWGGAGLPANFGNVRSIGAYGGTIYFGATNNQIYATTNTGASWAPVAPVTGVWQDIHVNPNYPADVYAVRGSFTGSSAGHVYRSTNGGANWVDISGNLKDQPYNAIKRDPKSGYLYVGGDDGVYYSTNYGSSWQRLGSLLPNAQVVDLSVSPGNGVLAAGTHGRGLWTYPLSPNVATPLLYPQPALSRNASNQIVVTLGLRNGGTGDATGVNFTSVTLNGTPTTITSGAASVGAVPAYAVRSGVAVYQSSLVPGAGAPLTLRVQGTSAQGNFSFNLRMTAP